MSVVAVPTAMGSGIDATMGTTVPAAAMTATTSMSAAAAGDRGHGKG